ncbi:MAG: metalloregulator ArsR/SmtB family transcription factor [Firmicutes bacterium]|nr:metalloregulator ArsR/SmtB family transcription factor [Bacillota bacterium]MDH7496784.1 metalloregulator ArsR/SmtB family transcription factor [Bacillota bacterium]
MEELLEKLKRFESTAYDYVSRFKALADPTRLKIMFLLKHGGELCVCDLTEALGIAQSGVSYHLRVLQEAGLIEKREHGTWSYCSLNETTVSEILSPKCCSVLGLCGDTEPWDPRFRWPR